MLSLSPSPSPIRTHISPEEMEILFVVALTGNVGHFVEYGKETVIHRFLVEDGYLTVEVRPGTSWSYSRYRLTDAGRKALALKWPCAGERDAAR